jgi:hypothetical protein
MIANIRSLEMYCKDYKSIENYEEALKSPLKYDLHHRREIAENKSKSDLIADNLYYDRPAAELIFLEQGEHTRLHNTNRSAETRQKLSISSKGHEGYFRGKPSPWKGRHWHLENGKHVYTE